MGKRNKFTRLVRQTNYRLSLELGAAQVVLQKNQPTKREEHTYDYVYVILHTIYDIKFCFFFLRIYNS